jgi:2-polyprenyl-3-methyl-5-hydroxy-6-metoxy-1,4-benzoquinol methylase
VNTAPTIANEIDSDNARFAFGKNWQRFSAGLTESQLHQAADSLLTMLGCDSLESKSFLDVGSGSGLFSAAAVLLGAARVHSFDYDPQSVACAEGLREGLPPRLQAGWVIEQGDATSADYMHSLGQYDVVYAWGSLHHTGAMWDAVGLVCNCVAPGGALFVSIYNDQGRRSEVWRRVKHSYNLSPRSLRLPFVMLVMTPFELRAAVGYALAGRLPEYLRSWRRGERPRGMSRWHDLVDWVGGYPFEVAKPDDVVAFGRERGLQLTRLQTCGGGWGCNQYIFERCA